MTSIDEATEAERHDYVRELLSRQRAVRAHPQQLQPGHRVGQQPQRHLQVRHPDEGEEEEQRHAVLRLVVFALAHVQVRVADDPAEIVVEVLMVLGIKRKDVFAQESRPGDFDAWVFEAFSVSEGVCWASCFYQIEG